MKMWRNIRKIIKNQGGFTVMEMVIGIAIIGIISAATATSVSQVFTGSNTSSNQMTAINNVRNAGDWITRDAQQAQAWKSNIVPDDTDSGEMIVLGDPPDKIEFVWYEYDPTDYPDTIRKVTVAYTIPTGTGNLTRVESVSTRIAGVWSAVVSGQPVIVAQNIEEVRRAFLYTDIDDTNILKLEITSEVGTGTYFADETRIFEIHMRPQR